MDSMERRNRRAILIAAAIVIGCYLWTQGTFDQALWKVGLNFNECATNGFGATFCGEQLEEYKARFETSP